MNTVNLKVIQSKQTGSTMIEILIAILVFSIGILGIVTSQTMTLTNTQSSSNKTLAAQYVYELVDIMRASGRVATRTTLATNPFLTFATVSSNGSRAEPVDAGVWNANCADIDDGTDCNALTYAGHELSLWENKVEALPDGQASITGASNGNTIVYTVLITWADAKSAAEIAGKTATDGAAYTNVAGETSQDAEVNGRSFYRYQLSFEL